MNFIYPAVFHKTKTGTYIADFPDLKMCHAEGETLDDCIENAHSAAYNWIYVELSEFDAELPSISDHEDICIRPQDIICNICVNIRLRDGWDE